MTRSKTILLVDDDSGVRQALGQALASEDHRVVSAANRAEALGEFNRQPIHVLLLDLNPQNEDAWETLRRLTALRPSLPTIAMTARAEQPWPAGSAHAFHAVLEKPLDLPLLIQTLNGITTQTPEVPAPL